MIFETAKISKVERFKNYVKLGFWTKNNGNTPKKVLPAQFLMIRPSKDFTLGRPLSIYDFKRVRGKTYLEIFFQIIGAGTGVLAKRQVGDKVEILWPLGNGYHPRLKNIVAVAGGCGVFPIYLLAKTAKQQNKNLVVLHGVKKGCELKINEDYKKLGTKIINVSEDGVCGKKGLVIDFLVETLKKINAQKNNTEIFSCGPKIMMERVYKIAKKFGLKSYFSLEEKMGCGHGACLSCVAPKANGQGYYLVCKDGPVFEGAGIFSTECGVRGTEKK